VEERERGVEGVERGNKPIFAITTSISPMISL
jgi:hypothetical protein